MVWLATLNSTQVIVLSDWQWTRQESRNTPLVGDWMAGLTALRNSYSIISRVLCDKNDIILLAAVHHIAKKQVRMVIISIPELNKVTKVWRVLHNYALTFTCYKMQYWPVHSFQEVLIAHQNNVVVDNSTAKCSPVAMCHIVNCKWILEYWCMGKNTIGHILCN